MNDRKEKDKEPIVIIEEPYTCTVCGRQNLKFQEIGYREDKDGQIDLSTVACTSCHWLSVWPILKKYIKAGHEKDAETLLKESVGDFEHNYNRRLLRRVLKKKD